MAVKLPARSDICVLADVKQQIQQALSAQQGLEIDTSDVERIDCAMLQLLLAAKLKAQQQQLPFTFSVLSTTTAQAISVLGMSSVFELPANNQ